MWSALSGPTDWILRYIKHTFYNILKELQAFHMRRSSLVFDANSGELNVNREQNQFVMEQHKTDNDQ